jgi:predicted dehydrogenase
MEKKYRVLVVGVGSIGERHVRTFLETQRASVSICETADAKRSEIAGRYAVQAAYSDLDAALVDKHDIAVIATPAHLHLAIAQRLAAKGLHLLIEKPLSTSLEGVEPLQEEIARRGIVVGVAYVWRCFPPLMEMRESIVSGRFGKPLEIVVTSGQHFPTFRPAYREIYYADRKTGGGAIQDLLTHLTNAGEWLLGPVDRLVCDASHQLLEGVEVEDTVHLITRQGGALGSYAVNQYQAPSEITITVVCEGGTARAELHDQRWKWKLGPNSEWEEKQAEFTERDFMFVAQANAFLDAVEGKTPPPCTFEEGLQTLRVNLAALESAEQSRWMSVR